MKKIFFLVLLLICIVSQAAKNPFKFGKVSNDELEMTSCPFYAEAESMVLGKIGRVEFRYTTEDGFQYVYHVTVRKKIFKVSGKDEANVKIKIYEPVAGQSNEDLMNVAGYTYNLVDGKVLKTKLRNENEYTTRINDYWVETSFALADVQEGSVIEYTYSKVSDFLGNLDTWYFQDDIPVAFSEFQVTIPEYFYYQVNQEGTYIPVDIVDETINEQFTYTTRSRGTAPSLSNNFSQAPTTTRNSFNSNSVYKKFTARDIPPVIDEPYMNNKKNIPARVKFQLMTIQYPGSPLEHIAGSYEKLNKSMLDRSTFGKTLGNGNFCKDELVLLGELSDVGKATALYYWLRRNVSWNELYGITSEKVGRRTFNEKEGSVADINLTLTAAFREAGLKSNPVILSTRGHGILNPFYPNYQDFNYVIAAVEIDDQLFLCDAASDMPFGMLPRHCLNGRGWMVSENDGHWVELKQGAITKTSITSNITVYEDKILATVKADYRDYSAINTFSDFKKSGKEEYQEKLAKNFNEWMVSSVDVNTSKSVDTVEVNFEITRECFDSELIYIQPITYGTILENPFVREDRFSPVDFPYSTRNTFMAVINVPEDYTAELPKPMIVKLPNGAGKFVYSASLIGDKINILSDFHLLKTDFPPNEYVYLKQFFQMASDKNQEVVVLKKVQ